MNKNQLISVCIATYNGEKYLQEQLNSILKQTYKNIEIIVQDDSSTDNTMKILNSYKDTNNITIYENEQNIGYIKNFESVLKKATGDFIALCDQDDIWDENKLELLINNIDNKSLIYSDSLLVDENGKSLNLKFSESLKNNFISTQNPLTFINDNCVSAHAMLFKKELLKYIFPFPPNVFFDAWIAANAASLNGIIYFDKCLVKYRQHATNTLSKRNKNHKNHKKQKNKISKAEKKLFIIKAKVKVIESFLKIQLLNDKDKKILEDLKNEYMKYDNFLFNKNLYSLLNKHKNSLYEISKKNKSRLILKDSIGYKIYKWFPFL
ncbi:MAG: glycosyltransferase family 2 protein [Sulfurimonadaceae bacterium]|jgi:glycosyltransferase involved in cell wall biosynthesis|nr:glycosyltransferase family 2 protein [Sulfurimonadaceae bacterium]